MICFTINKDCFQSSKISKAIYHLLAVFSDLMTLYFHILGSIYKINQIPSNKPIKTSMQTLFTYDPQSPLVPHDHQ